MLHKAYKKDDYEEIHFIEQNKEMRRQNRRDSCFRKLIEEKNILANPSLLRNLQTPSKSKLTAIKSKSLTRFQTIPVSAPMT